MARNGPLKSFLQTKGFENNLLLKFVEGGETIVRSRRHLLDFCVCDGKLSMESQRARRDRRMAPR